MPAFKCSGCQSLFASRAQLRIHQRETGCFRTVIENALAASTVVRDSSASPVLDQMERSSRPVIDRHEGTTEVIVEQDDVPDFEGISPVASVTSNDPMDIEEVDQVVDAQVEEEPIDTEVFEEEDLAERGPIVQQWVEDAQLDECDDLAMKLMRVFDTNKISRQGQRNIFKCLNVEFMTKVGSDSVFTGKHFKTPDTYRRIISKNSATTVWYDICPNGCYLYPVGDSTEVTCPNVSCGANRYKNANAVNIEDRDPTMPVPALVPQQQMAYTSISQALTQLYVDDERIEMLSYRDHFFDNASLNQIYRDVFSGDSYTKLLEKDNMRDNTICLVIFVDGYQPKNVRKAHQVMINCLIMNIHPKYRTKEENMIQVAICPRKPHDLSSFLRPLIAEVNQLYNRGLIIKKGDEIRYDGNVAILGFTGDIPGIAQLINFVGHTGTHGCRICLVVADDHTEHVRHGQYFSTEAAERTMESLLQGDEDHGMRGIPHLIGSLETFLGVYSFFGDELHMLGHGIGHLISDLLDPSPRNKFKVAGSSEYTFDVQEGLTLRSFMECINRWIDDSKRTTPTVFDFSFDHKKHFFRAVDWQHVLLHVAPTIIAPYLKSNAATDALMDLVNACSISLQRSISPNELAYMERAFDRWGNFLRREIRANRLSMRVWTMNNHFAVRHVPELIRQQGPLRYFSCRSLERTIKKYSNMVNSMSAPDIEISNIHNRVNYYKEHRSTDAAQSYMLPSSSRQRDFYDHPTHPAATPRLWSKIQHLELRDQADFFGASTWQLINALQRYYSRLGLSGSVIDSQQITIAGSMLKDDVYFHSRLHRTNNTLLKRSNHLVLFEAKRANSNIKYWYIGEVLMYFEHVLNGTSRFLALVSVMPNASMDEYGIVRVTYNHQTLNEQFMVCNTLDVITIIGLVRYNDIETDFKVIWPDAKYYQKLDGRIHQEELL